MKTGKPASMQPSLRSKDKHYPRSPPVSPCTVLSNPAPLPWLPKWLLEGTVLIMFCLLLNSRLTWLVASSCSLSIRRTVVPVHSTRGSQHRTGDASVLPRTGTRSCGNRAAVTFSHTGSRACVHTFAKERGHHSHGAPPSCLPREDNLCPKCPCGYPPPALLPLCPAPRPPTMIGGVRRFLASLGAEKRRSGFHVCFSNDWLRLSFFSF